MPTNDRDVFAFLTSDPATSTEIDFLTYAYYTFEKYQWVEQFEQTRGRPPDAAEVERWIADITPNRFSGLRDQAATFFDSTARAYLRDDIEAQTQAAVRNSILAEVKAAGAFWRQMAVALVTAILAPLIIGAVIAAALTYDRVLPTATVLSHQLSNPPAPTP